MPFGVVLCLPFPVFDLDTPFQEQVSCLMWDNQRSGSVDSRRPVWLWLLGLATQPLASQVSHSFAAQFMWTTAKAHLSLMANPCLSSSFVPELILS